jgi:hypothetical protein
MVAPRASNGSESPIDLFDDWYLTRPIVTFEPDPVGGGTMIQPADVAQAGPPRPRYG